MKVFLTDLKKNKTKREKRRTRYWWSFDGKRRWRWRLQKTKNSRAL